METPTNSILNRDAGDGALISQVVYENESLKIEIEALREKLESTRLLKVDELRCENDALKGEVDKLRTQLAEKESQLALHRTSNDRFSNIDQSLHELLTQVQTQRTELAEMKGSTREKETRIAQLSAQLKQSEEAVKEATAKAAAASAAATQSSLQAAESERLLAQLKQANAELETCRQASEQEVAEVQSQLKEAQEQLMSMKEEAAAKSRVRGRQASQQEQEIENCREREANTQRQVVNLQAKMEVLVRECSQLREANADLVRKQQDQLQQQAAVTAATQCIDLCSPEVKAHVEKAVRQATEGVERRLREQVEQNASLLSRMALMQQESEAAMKTKGMTTHEVSVMKERVDVRSRHNEARTVMQRRVAELLSNEELSKRDIEVLLQEMLDYQEEADQENRTLLLIKDIASEEKERALAQALKRVSNENASLMKQLQQLAMEGFQRERTSGGGGMGEPAAAEGEPATATGAPTSGAMPEEGQAPMSPFGLNTGGGALSGATVVHPAMQPPAAYTPGSPDRMPPSQPHTAVFPYPQQPHQRQPQHTQPHFTGDLWSHSPSRYSQGASAMTNTHADPYNHLFHCPPYTPDAPAASAAPTVGDEWGRHRETIVQCPACTFEQRYGNRQCEICEAPLRLN
ncbi:hypothetical protein LSCM1_02175 [Leishmania martiniquensis]|uniref:Uncharacterized protein n=1 Tax=Leishmania martiniquensis TaxID=1580590 RepID=A0A836K9F5_9TRYP|nr:hypothetical protein LSCM1_02175 [Leishmania martiniquensis]